MSPSALFQREKIFFRFFLWKSPNKVNIVKAGDGGGGDHNNRRTQGSASSIIFLTDWNSHTQCCGNISASD